MHVFVFEFECTYLNLNLNLNARYSPRDDWRSTSNDLGLEVGGLSFLYNTDMWLTDKSWSSLTPICQIIKPEHLGFNWKSIES